MKQLYFLFLGFFLVASSATHAQLQLGSVDTTFRARSLGHRDQVTKVIPLPNGQVLVAGGVTAVDYFRGTRKATMRNGAARFNADGSVDESFAPNFVENAGPLLNQMLLQPDGKILLAGQFRIYPPTRINRSDLIRLNPDGTTDATFRSPDLQSVREVFGLALQPDGKILAAGLFFDFPNQRHLVRFNPDGSLDTSFPSVRVEGWAVQSLYRYPDGLLLLGGRSLPATAYHAGALPDCCPTALSIPPLTRGRALM